MKSEKDVHYVISSWLCLSKSEGGFVGPQAPRLWVILKEHKKSCNVTYSEYCTRLMSSSYVCGFNLIKSEYHEINIVAVSFVNGGRNKQVKTTSSYFPRGQKEK